jgi:hypothetical protein
MRGHEVDEEMFGEVSKVVYGVRRNASKSFMGYAYQGEGKCPTSDFIWYSVEGHMGPKFLKVGHVVGGPIMKRHGRNSELRGQRKIQHPRCKRQIHTLKRIFYCC